MTYYRREISPSSFIQRQRRKKQRFRRLRRWRRATLNWLNGLPVQQGDEFDSGSVSNESVSNNNNNVANDRKAKRGWKKLRWYMKKKRQPSNIIIENPVVPNLTREASKSPLDSDEQSLLPKKDHPLELDRQPVRVIQLPPEPIAPAPRVNVKDDIHSTTISNEILTAKYTVLNFIPKNLLEQLRRVANVYFVLIIILQCIPGISNYNPILAAAPVLVIFAVTAIKDAVEDWRRHKQDNEVNYSTCWILHRPKDKEAPVIERDTRWQKLLNLCWSLRDTVILAVERVHCRLKRKPFILKGRYRQLTVPQSETITWQETFWRDIRVGDIVLLRNDEMIPADIVLLSTSEPDGVCFVETKNLDGETNLKLKKSPIDTSWIQTSADAYYLKATVEVELPHVNLYSFLGTMIIAKGFEPYEALSETKLSAEDDSDQCMASTSTNAPRLSDTKIEELSKSVAMDKDSMCFLEPKILPLNGESLLLRGCILRNTPYVIGVVAYTGPHTKLMMNSGGTPSKRTRIERQMNPQIILIFVLLFAICLSCAIVQTQFSQSTSNAPYWVSSFQ